MINYVLKNNIYEVDMSNAGLSIIQEYKLLGDDIINYIINLPKPKRSIFIGKLDRDNKTLKLSRNITDGINYHLDLFIKENDIDNSNIIIRNRDAVFIKSIQPVKLHFGNYIEFKIKNIFDLYLKIDKLDLFYNSTINKYILKNITNKNNIKECELLISSILTILNNIKINNIHNAFIEFNKLRYIITNRLVLSYLINLYSCSYEVNCNQSIMRFNTISVDELDIINDISIEFHLKTLFPLLTTILLENA